MAEVRNGNVVSPPSNFSSFRTSQDARQRIGNYMGHAVHMVSQLHDQNQMASPPLKRIYQNAQERLQDLNSRLQEKFSIIRPEKQKEINNLRYQLKRLKSIISHEKSKKEDVNNFLNKLKKSVNKPSNKRNLLFDLNSNLLHLDNNLMKMSIHSIKLRSKLRNLEKQVNAPATSENPTYELSKKDVKKLKKVLEEAEKEIVTIIHETQIEAVAEIAKQSVKDDPEKASLIRDKVISLAKGGLGAKWIRFLSVVSTTNREAITAFQAAHKLMVDASKQAPEPHLPESHLHAERRGEFARQDSLHQRAGVVGLGGLYRIHIFFSKDKIKKQLKSFVAQNLGETVRTTIERTVQIGEQTATSRQIPLNQSFDLYLAVRGTLSAVFSSIFGTKGISSANRQEPHLVNGYESHLMIKGKIVFRALRHAITSDRYQKDLEIRAENSKKAAAELLKAALLQEIAAQGLTVKQASEKGIQLSVNSVSLVTPDDMRRFLPGQVNEQQLLLDQVLALRSLAGDQIIELDGIPIHLHVNVNTFNFGVNYLATNLGWGLSHQYELNVIALKGFREQFASFQRNVEGKIDPETSAHAEALMKDIELLMQDKKAYLKGDNQYEIGAKILNLTSLMDQAIEKINQDLPPNEKLNGYKGAVNCMSGKDRTGFLDAVAKAFAFMAEENGGRYPTHAELMQPQNQKKFAEVLVSFLLKGGGLEIAEINTGAKGYKVNEEARLFGIPAETFLQIQGLSSTTGA